MGSSTKKYITEHSKYILLKMTGILQVHGYLCTHSCTKSRRESGDELVPLEKKSEVIHSRYNIELTAANSVIIELLKCLSRLNGRFK